MSCVLPAANGPWRKLACCFMGVGSVAGTAFGLKFAVQHGDWSWNWNPETRAAINSLNNATKHIPSPSDQTIDLLDSGMNRLNTFASQFRVIGTFFGGLTFGTIGVSSFTFCGVYAFTMVQEIRVSNKCCDIIRSTAFNSVRLPFYAFAGVSGFYFANGLFKDWYHLMLAERQH